MLTTVLALLFAVVSAKSQSPALEDKGAAAKTRPAAETGYKNLLSAEERSWLLQHPNIRVGVTVIPPQVLLERGEYVGLSIDYIRLMETKLDCRFKLAPYATWNEVIEAAKKKQIDMIFAAQMTPERSTYLQFSKPYIELPNMILVRKDRTGGATLNEMSGWRVAVSEGSAVHEYLRSNFPDLVLFPVRDELEGLMKVSLGEADAIVVEISRASYYIDKAGIMNLRASGSTDFLYKLRFAVRSDWPTLTGVLNKGLDSVTDAEARDINQRWIAVDTRSIFANKYFWMILGTVLLVILFVVAWNLTLRRVVQRRTAELQMELAERKRVEAEIRRLNEHLESRVQARTEQLKKANEELEAFSYSVSHDLRVPLRAISGYSQMLVEDYGDKLGADGRNYAEIIQSRAVTMAQLIDELLSFSRMRREMDATAIDMRQLVQDVFDELVGLQAEPRTRLVLKELPPCNGDHAMIRQALQNLLSNAIKFSAKRTDATVEVGGKVGADQLEYYVRDNGAGFEMSQADKLFGVFQRLHSRDEFEGTGLGLAIVKRIIERHGGRVWAEAKPGEGATFHFSMPRHPAS